MTGTIRLRSGNGARILGVALVVAMVAGGLLFLGVAVDEFGRRGLLYAFMGVLGELALFSILALGPVGRAIGGLLEGDQHPDPMQANRLADVEDRLSEISGEVQRLSEIESRLEFAERLLANPAVDYPREGRR